MIEAEFEFVPSVTRCLSYYFNIWPFRTMKIAQKYVIFAKVGSQFCQILNSYSRKGQALFKIMPKWRNFTISGHTVCTLTKLHQSRLGIM